MYGIEQVAQSSAKIVVSTGESAITPRFSGSDVQGEIIIFVDLYVVTQIDQFSRI